MSHFLSIRRRAGSAPLHHLAVRVTDTAKSGRRAKQEMPLSGQEFKTGFRHYAALSTALLASSLVLGGCNTSETFKVSETINQGYVADTNAVDLVPVGSSREQVLLALGTPSTTATFDNEVFYYISQQRTRSVAFMKTKLVAQNVLAVYFGPDGTVANIANYGIKDGKVFDFVKRVTPTGGKDVTFIGQILGGLSKGTAPNLSKDDGGLGGGL
jgi:outer membrane protein assembly factor BamE (lipoprotein component of BamABCDE complex)